MLSPLLPPSALEQPRTAEGKSLLATLEDISDFVAIQDDFCIRHVHSSPLELPQGLLKGLQQLPLPQQNHYLRWRVSTYLYSLYEDGKRQASATEGSVGVSEPDALFQNKTVGARSDFYHQLHHSNRGQGYFDPGWVFIKESADGLLAVKKDGLTMHVSRDRHLAQTAVTPGDTVSVRLPNSQIENGYYVAVGNQGPCPNGTSINLYFNVTLEGILRVMHELTTMLNELRLPFSLAVPYDLENCPERCDAGTLKIAQPAYAKVQPKLDPFYQIHAAQFRSTVPLFAKVLAPGLGLSEQPLHSFIPQESFAMHRFQVLAEGLIHAWRQDLNSSQDRKTCMLQALFEHEISLSYPYLNPGAKDEYALITP